MPLLEKRDYRPKINITQEQAEFLKANCTKIALLDFAKMWGVSVSKVHVWKNELGLAGTRVRTQVKRKENRHDDYYFDWSSAKKTDFILNNC